MPRLPPTPHSMEANEPCLGRWVHDDASGLRALSWSLWMSQIRTPPGENHRMWAGTLLSRRLEVGPDTDTTQLLRAMWKEDDDRGSPDSDLTQEIRNRFAYNMKGIGW